MAEENATRKCKQDTCTVSLDGKCLEGLDPDKCPHHFYLQSSEDVNSTIEASTTTTDSNKFIPLFGGLAFSSKDVSLITYKAFCEKIFIIGESGSGKTTFLATIFDSFQKGPINDIHFAGSYTQIGFEERCHLSRLISKAAVPDTEKTSTMEFKFLHLAVKKSSGLNKPSIHFLISDISGERLRSARDSSSAMQELNLLKTSSDIIYMIDGEKLSNRTTRQSTIFKTDTFIQRSLDDEILGSGTDFKIVVSKWDMLYQDNKFDFEVEIVNHFKEKFGSRFSSISFAKIAARPKKADTEIKYGYGVFELLNEWIEKSLIRNVKRDVDQKIRGDRFFDNFK